MRCSLEICHPSTFISVCVFPIFPNPFFFFNLVAFMLVAFGKNLKGGLSRTRTRLQVWTSLRGSLHIHDRLWSAHYNTRSHDLLTCTLHRHVLCTDILICSHTQMHTYTHEHSTALLTRLKWRWGPKWLALSSSEKTGAAYWNTYYQLFNLALSLSSITRLGLMAVASMPRAPSLNVIPLCPLLPIFLFIHLSATRLQTKT